MSRLTFLSPDESDAEVPRVSPLRHVLTDAFSDASALGKLEVRGNVSRLEPLAGEELVPIGPDRALLVVDAHTGAARERLLAEGYRVYDMSSALAGLEVEGEGLMRRLTELDLDRLPAIGAIARGTTALIERRGGERFRLFVPQELGQYVAEVISDLDAGLRG